jgi:hypothetical protein
MPSPGSRRMGDPSISGAGGRSTRRRAGAP